MGTPDFSLPVLESLVNSRHEVVGVYTRPDRPAGRGRQLVSSPVKQAAVAAGIPVREPRSLREETSASELAALRPDLVVVAAFAYILPPEVLGVPRYGCLNVHPSLLPRYRGPSPVATALLNGDTETGVSIMLMDSGLDTGPVLAAERVSIGDEDTTGSLTRRLFEVGARLLLVAIDDWLDGRLRPAPQRESEVSVSSRITAHEGKLDWSLPAAVLDRKVRAYHPWPGGHTVWKGQRLKVHRATPLSLAVSEPPGTVVELKQPFCVGASTGDGVLALRSVQLEGKREVTAEEFIRGHRDFLGSRLES